jgi:hypothetical protein
MGQRGIKAKPVCHVLAGNRPYARFTLDEPLSGPVNISGQSSNVGYAYRRRRFLGHCAAFAYGVEEISGAQLHGASNVNERASGAAVNTHLVVIPPPNAQRRLAVSVRRTMG